MNGSFIKNIKKNIADKFKLSIEQNSTGENAYYVEFVVTSQIHEDIVHKDKITAELYEIISKMSNLPVELEIGNDTFDYKVNYIEMKKRKDL